MLGNRLVQFVAALLTGVQLVFAVANAPALVLCSGADGHQAIEVAHGPASCEAVLEHAAASADEASASLHTDTGEPCKDVALGTELVQRPEHSNRLAISPIIAPVLFELPVSIESRPTHSVTARISSTPDSAESLSRHIILLI